MALLSSDINDFTKLDKLGEGTYGVVYKAKNNKTDELVALKQIRLEKDSEEGMPATSVREISALLELRHPNVVWLQDVIMNEKGLYLVFELCTVDLKEYLDSIPGGRLPGSKVKSFLFQICQGMCFCHQRRIIHRDLKPQNLLIDTKTGAIKLADFGLARAVSIPVRAYTHEIVTLWYRAPEVLLGKKRYSIGVDIWSIACIFGEMARGAALFYGDSEIDQLFKIFKVLGTPTEKVWRDAMKLHKFIGSFPNWNVNTLADEMQGCLSEAGIELLQAMFRYDPVERISTRDILNHHYFDDLDTSVLPAGDFRGDLQS